MLKLRSIPNTIATCYIPPADSPYLSFTPIAEINDEMKSNARNNVIVIGDLNLQFGDSRRRLIEGKPLPQVTLYRPPKDQIKQPNSNARFITDTLENMLILHASQRPTVSSATT
jgi:hypothetical protein